MKITTASHELFMDLAKDAPNWSGTPLLGGNVEITKEERGNLTQLKRAGLLTTRLDEGNVWVYFTAAGEAYAAENGVDLA